MSAPKIVITGLKWDTACLQDTLTPVLGKAERDFITHGEGAKCESVLCDVVAPVNVVQLLKEVNGAINKSADFECVPSTHSRI